MALPTGNLCSVEIISSFVLWFSDSFGCIVDCITVDSLINHVQKKVVHLNLSYLLRMWTNFVKLSSLADSQGNSLCNCDYDIHLTRTTLLHYLVKLENSK